MKEIKKITIDSILEETTKVYLDLTENKNDKYMAFACSKKYVLTVENNKPYYHNHSYKQLVKNHDEVMKQYDVKYNDVLFRLVGEGYNFPHS